MLFAGIILINVKLSMFDLSPAFISETCSSVMSSVIAWVLFVKSEKSKSKVLIRLARTIKRILSHREPKYLKCMIATQWGLRLKL